MSIAHIIAQFIETNKKAYDGAATIFKRIEANDFAADLAALGITGSDIRVYATIYVHKATGVKPHPSQRGGALTFKKDTSEYNRVKYLVDVATGVREARVKASASVDPVAKLVDGFNKLTGAEQRKFLKLIGA